jgi:type I restriction enzyme S subunit
MTSLQVEHSKSKTDSLVGTGTTKASAFFTCSKETFWIDHYAFDTEAILLSGNNAQAIYSVKHYKGKFNAYQGTYVITVKDTARISYRFLSQMLSRSLERLRVISIGSSTKYLK